MPARVRPTLDWCILTMQACPGHEGTRKVPLQVEPSPLHITSIYSSFHAQFYYHLGRKLPCQILWFAALSYAIQSKELCRATFLITLSIQRWKIGNLHHAGPHRLEVAPQRPGHFYLRCKRQKDAVRKKKVVRLKRVLCKIHHFSFQFKSPTATRFPPILIPCTGNQVQALRDRRYSTDEKAPIRLPSDFLHVPIPAARFHSNSCGCQCITLTGSPNITNDIQRTGGAEEKEAMEIRHQASKTLTLPLTRSESMSGRRHSPCSGWKTVVFQILCATRRWAPTVLSSKELSMHHQLSATPSASSLAFMRASFRTWVGLFQLERLFWTLVHFVTKFLKNIGGWLWTARVSVQVLQFLCLLSSKPWAMTSHSWNSSSPTCHTLSAVVFTAVQWHEFSNHLSLQDLFQFFSSTFEDKDVLKADNVRNL